MADEKDLTLNFHLKNFADAVTKKFHAEEKRRIAEWRKEREAGEKALTEIFKREAKERLEAQRKVEREMMAAKKAAEKEALAAQKQALAEAKRIAAEELAAKKAADKEALASMRQAEKEARDLARQSSKDVAAAKREAAKEEKRLLDESRRVFNEKKREELRIVREVQSRISQEENDRFRDWKAKTDFQHRQFMKNKREEAREAKAADDAVMNLGSAFGVASVGLASLSLGRETLRAISQGAIESSRDLARMSEEFLRLRDNFRELSGVMGKKNDIQNTLEQIKFGSKTGQTGDEVRSFRTSFHGEAQQFKDRFAPGEFEKFEIAAAKLQVKEGLEADVAGKNAAAAIRTLPKGQKNLTADQVIAPMAEGFDILQAGSGSNPVLARQYSRVIAEGIGPEGQFKNHREAAVAVRVQSQFNDEDSAMHARSIQRGINQLDDKQARALGLNDDQNFFQQMEAIRAAYKKSGVKKLSKFLDKAGFSDERTRVGIATHINEGIEGGVVDAAFKDAAKFDIGKYKQETEDFYRDPSQSGKQRVEEAKTKVKEAEISQYKSTIKPLMTEVGRRRLDIDTSQQAKANNQLLSYVSPVGWLEGQAGYADHNQFLQYNSAIKLQEMRAKRAGVQFQPMGEMSMFNPTAIGDVERHLAKLLEATERQNKLLEEANKQRDEAKRQPVKSLPSDGKPVPKPARPN